MEEGWEGVCTSQAVLNSYMTWLETRPVRQNSRKGFAIFMYKTIVRSMYLSTTHGDGHHLPYLLQHLAFSETIAYKVNT